MSLLKGAGMVPIRMRLPFLSLTKPRRTFLMRVLLDRKGVAAPGRSATAVEYERSRRVGRFRRVLRPRGDPVLGLLQHRRPQQQPPESRSSVRRPAMRNLAKLRMHSMLVASASARRFALSSNCASSSKKMNLRRASVSGTALSSTRTSTIRPSAATVLATKSSRSCGPARDTPSPTNWM